jgi:hypothetical protein
MTNKRIELGERLFEDYSRNLSFYHPPLEHTFLCPLCLQPFNKNAIQSGKLTIEHIIPAGIGGKLVTLTCKECNSESGHRLDAHLVQRMRVEDILAGKSDLPLRIRINVGKGEFGGDLYLSNDQHPNIQIIGLQDISNPKLHKLALNEFDTGLKVLSIHGSLGFKEIPSRVAALRVAYLLMFRYFGYGYIQYENRYFILKKRRILLGRCFGSEIPLRVTSLQSSSNHQNSVAFKPSLTFHQTSNALFV